MSGTNTLLVEIGTEELPTSCQHDLAASLAENLGEILREDMLFPFTEKTFFSTPRRLAVLYHGLQEYQNEVRIQCPGPPLKRAFDEYGNATAAAIGFAKKFNVEVHELERNEKTGRLIFDSTVAGKKIDVLLPQAFKEAVESLHLPARMRWGSHCHEFIRPIRWLCVLYGSREIKIQFADIEADRCTRGHLHHFPWAMTLAQANDYQTVLREQGKVEVDPAVRRKKILDATRAAARETGGELCESEKLLDEITAMVEWPLAVAGSFDKCFLTLPQEVILETLHKTLKAFAVSKNGNDSEKLLPCFVTVANVDSKNPQRVRAGYEKVAQPRLEDALFFYEQDGKKTLHARVPELAGISFHVRLGSLADKSRRVQSLVNQLAPLCGAQTEVVNEAAQLCKTDLLTDMVKEHPSLQGIIGKCYALRDGLPAEVAKAIEEHLLPRQSNDVLPSTPAGITLALADHLDSLVGIFSTDYKAAGSGDPLGARRQALGFLRILVERRIDISSEVWLAKAQQPFSAMGLPDATDETSNFLNQRFMVWCLERGHVRAQISAICARKPDGFYDASLRLSALNQFMRSSAAGQLAEINKRLKNILRKAPNTTVNCELFKCKAETNLYSCYKERSAEIHQLCAKRKYFSAMHKLSLLHKPLDQFFVEVMVMCENEALRNNRLALLRSLQTLFLKIADFSRL